MSKLNDERKKIVDSICSRLEKGEIPWKADWECFSQTPVNAVSGRRYQGGNSFRLSFIAAEKGYTDNRWCTFLQAQEKGWKIKAGSKSCCIEFFSLPKEEDIEKAKAGEDVPKEKLRPIAKLYHVFNAKDIEGIPPLAVKKSDPIERIEKAERILQESGAVIKYQGDKAFYRPSTDEIVLPPKELFHSTEGFYSTALHELGHWTGHESRLNRFSQEVVKLKEDRAKEELRAELASVFVGSETGIKQDEGHFENHVAYLGSWLKALRNDPNELFRAANDADKISEYILQHERTRERENFKEQEAEIPQGADKFIIVNPDNMMLDSERGGDNGGWVDINYYNPDNTDIVFRYTHATRKDAENDLRSYQEENKGQIYVSNEGKVITEKEMLNVLANIKGKDEEFLQNASYFFPEYDDNVSSDEVAALIIPQDNKKIKMFDNKISKSLIEASKKQIEYMKAISDISGLEVIEDVKQNSKSASNWIKTGLEYCDKNGIVIDSNKQQEFMKILSENTARAIPEETFSNPKEASKWIKENLDILDKYNIKFATEKQIILIEAKETLGSQAFVTNAKNDATYDGKIIASSENYAVQEISGGKGILHSLENNPALETFIESENMDMSVRINYKAGQASIGNIEKEENMEIEEENTY